VYIKATQHAGVKKRTFKKKLGQDNKTSLDQSVRLQGPPMSHIFTLLDYQHPNINTKGKKEMMITK
jgi:hypothetical protein